MCGAGMRYTILLVCADKMLLDTRSLVLEIAGYRTLRASTLMSGLGLAFCLQFGRHRYHLFRRSTGGIPRASTQQESQHFSSPFGYKGDSTRIVGGNGRKVLPLGSPTGWQPNNQPRCCAELRESVWLFAQAILRRCYKDLSRH